MLHQLESVAEGVEGVHADETREWLLRLDRTACGSAALDVDGQIIDEERRVRIRGSDEFGIRPEMETRRARAKPDSAALARFGFGISGRPSTPV